VKRVGTGSRPAPTARRGRGGGESEEPSDKGDGRGGGGGGGGVIIRRKLKTSSLKKRLNRRLSNETKLFKESTPRRSKQSRVFPQMSSFAVLQRFPRISQGTQKELDPEAKPIPRPPKPLNLSQELYLGEEKKKISVMNDCGNRRDPWNCRGEKTVLGPGGADDGKERTSAGRVPKNVTCE